MTSPGAEVALITVLDALAEIRGRDLGREGIPMLLALPDAPPAAADSPRRRLGRRLAEQLAAIHAELALRHTPTDDAEEARVLSEDERLLIDAVAVLAHVELARPPARFAFAAEIEQLARSDSAPLARMLSALGEGRFLTVVNYHNTARVDAERISAELARWGARYAPVGPAELAALIDRGEWPAEREPLIPVFYEGYANHAEVAAPALAAAGLIGWFFVVTGFLDAPAADQRAFAQARDIGLVSAERDGSAPLALSWATAAELARDHVVCAHTADHVAAHSVAEADDVAREITRPHAAVAAHTGQPGVAHAWLYGSALANAPQHRDALAAAGVRWLFSNLAIDKVA